jgi:small subunit ribosomal protein S6
MVVGLPQVYWQGFAPASIMAVEEIVRWGLAICPKVSTFAPQSNFSPPNFHPVVMEVRNYETVFILTPVLNESQVQETVEKFTQVLKENSADVLSTEAWGLRKLAYPIQKKSTGYYFVVEFTAENGNIVNTLELAFRRDERIIRFLTTVLDKHAVAYNQRRRNGEMNQQKAAKEEAVAQ